MAMSFSRFLAVVATALAVAWTIMGIAIGAFAMMLWAAFCPAHAEDGTDFVQGFEVVQPPPVPSSPVVQIMYNGVFTAGTGFYVGDDWIVTAGHVAAAVGLGATFNVVADTGVTYQGTLAVFSDFTAGGDDMAILKIGGTPGGWVPAAMDCSGKEPAIGAEVRAEGFPSVEANYYRVTWGRINGHNAPLGEFKRPTIHAQVLVDKGNSGGPLFRESDNRVIGIVVAYNPENHNYSTSTPISVVCDALHR